jgi:hypothetical protein
MRNIKMKLATDWIKNVEQSKLKEIVKSLDSDTYDKLFWALMGRDIEEFTFSMREYLEEWRPEFEDRYTSFDMGLVIERLDKTKDNIDNDLATEYHYLQYWFNKESQVGGIFNYY